MLYQDAVQSTGMLQRTKRTIEPQAHHVVDMVSPTSHGRYVYFQRAPRQMFLDSTNGVARTAIPEYQFGVSKISIRQRT